MKFIVDSLPYYMEECPFKGGLCIDDGDCPSTWDKYKVCSDENPHECYLLIEKRKIDIQEPKIGYWEEYGHNISDSYIWDGVRCSVCKGDAQVKTRFIKCEPVIWSRDCFELTNYCPHCGAKMQ